MAQRIPRRTLAVVSALCAGVSVVALLALFGANTQNTDLEGRVAKLEKEVGEIRALATQALAAAQARPGSDGQADAARPSEIKPLVQAWLSEHRVPPAWLKTDFAAPHEALQSAELVEWGKQRSDGSWPAKVRVVGTAKRTGFGTLIEYDHVAEFVFYIDDYGKWQARAE